MIIYNTTFHADHSHKDEFVQFLTETYIPKALEGGLLMDAQLAKVMGNEEGGVSYALQFKAESLDSLDLWNGRIGMELTSMITQKFQHKVAGFSTLLELL